MSLPATLRRKTFALVIGAALAGTVAPTQARDVSMADLMQELKRLSTRVEKLEQRNSELEKALANEHVSEKEPELAARLKAVESQALGMQKPTRAIEALEGVTAGVSFTTVAQGVNGGGTTDRTGESQLNYRADVMVELPTGSIGNAEGKLFGHFRMGQGNGLGSLNPTFSGPNTTAFQLGGVTRADDSAALLAQAWYQADIPLPLGGFKDRSREKMSVNFGKMDPFLFFDQNAAANDETRQFLNNVFVHSPMLDAGGDIGADAYGFAPGMRLAYLNETQKPETYGLSAGVFAADAGANYGKSFGSPFVILQAETTQKFFGGLDGNYRLYLWQNGRAAAYRNSSDSGRERHKGWGVSADQRVGDATTLFGRYGHQTQGRVKFDRALTLGAEFGGSYWDRAGDALGVAFAHLRTSNDFKRDSLTLDANADGTADFGYQADGAERVAEVYYRWRLAKQFEITPDVQFIRRPGGDGTKPGIEIVGARAQLTF
ncbi:MAG: carbohydrate porin [Gammaproteobacteria bacterium]|nr:MAG: carbohydrate porin [Gammaproteobacteria bacterium]